jgi:type II secretory pathway pseudopilin PulG
VRERAVRTPFRPVVGRLRQRMSRDDGTSLIELMVGMMLMAIFMGMFTGAVVMMNNAMNKSQAVNLTASQLNVAFLNLDNTVRYAAFISTPGVGTSGDWYVELRVTDTGAEVCTQLRVDIASQQLQRRTWTVVNAVASTPGAWAPISSGISNGGAVSGASTQPFYLLPALANTVFQQLTINLISPSGSGSSLTNSTSSFTFTALNSIIPAPTAPICQQQGRP